MNVNHKDLFCKQIKLHYLFGNSWFLYRFAFICRFVRNEFEMMKKGTSNSTFSCLGSKYFVQKSECHNKSMICHQLSIINSNMIYRAFGEFEQVFIVFSVVSDWDERESVYEGTLQCVKFHSS